MALRDELLSRLPETLRTSLRPVGRLCVDTWVRISQLDEVNAWLEQHRHVTGFNFVEEALDFLNVRALIDPEELNQLPRTGAAIVVANHPLGAVDALLLLKLIGERRSDVRILANDWLMQLAPVRELLIPVNVFGDGQRGNASARELALAALARDELLIVFPAAEVSRLGLGGVSDPRWHLGFVHLARQSSATIIPVHVGGRNSWSFYLSSLALKPLGTALLPRELMRARGARIAVRMGAPMALPDSNKLGLRQAAALVRAKLFDLPKRIAKRLNPDQLPAPVDRQLLRQELLQLPCLGETPDGKQIFAGQVRMGGSLMREIARLRELSFRAVGEGSGARFDWDRYDADYDQLILWDAPLQEIAGAYRLKRTAGVATAEIYTASLFRFAPTFAPYQAQGCELGRSFVQPKYWGSRSLDWLWYGIGAYLNQYPDVRYLFGPVSASAALGQPARQLLTDYYARHFPDTEGLAQALQPWPGSPSATPALDAEQEFAVLKANLQALGAKVPTLYRQYTELCEPGGVRFLAFGLDPQFAQCVDGLILVDLARLKPKKRARYFGRQQPSLALAS